MSSPGRRGFTLLEVMLAIAILALAMMGISQVTSAALRNHERAVRLEIATLLARGKLASLVDDYQKSGFSDFDESDQGTFEAEGHPEVHFKTDLKMPKVDLGPQQILALLMGSKDLSDNIDLASLLGQKAQTGSDQEAGIQSLFPGAAGLASGMNSQLTAIGEELKQGLHELTLTVSWKDGSVTESFSVKTHLVIFPSGSTQ